MRTTIPSGLFTASISTLFGLSRLASAQLTGCGDVGCPVGEYNETRCAVGGITTSAIGIASLNTSISSQPLTWTVMNEDVGDQGNDRHFFFGTPPSLDLNRKDADLMYRGCALFFEGISTNLRFHSNANREFDVGSCGDALNARCVDSLLLQARTQLSTLIESGRNVSSTCTALEMALQERAPEGCTVARNGSWGDILARTLTGSDAAPVIRQGDCHPTIGPSYNLSLVASYRRTAAGNDFGALAPIIYGITPVMTIFYSDTSGSAVSGSLREPEVQLTCVKVVGDRGRQLVRGASITLQANTMLVALAAFVPLIILHHYNLVDLWH